MPGYTLQDGLTLKNKLGATSHEKLEAAETDYVKNRLFDFAIGEGPKGAFDVAHLKAVHRHLFQDVYEWAGCTRDERVVLSDGSKCPDCRISCKIGSRSYLASETA